MTAGKGLIPPAAAGRDDVFLYGTLAHEAVLAAVRGRPAAPGELLPATLGGYRRERVLSTGYPTLVADPAAEVKGLLLRRPDPDELRRLNRFEAEEYAAARVTVTVEGRTQEAWVYLALDAMRPSGAPWDLETWAARHLADYLGRIDGWLDEWAEPSHEIEGGARAEEDAMQADPQAAFAELFEGLTLLGPSSTATRRRVLDLVEADLPAAPSVCDMGAGVGAASRFLEKALPGARILALDRALGFLRRLSATRPNRVLAVAADMAAAPLCRGSLDLIWCESAIYAIGRRRALALWQELLRPCARIVFSDAVWLVPAAERPAEALAFWSAAYPDMQDVDGIRAEIEAAGWRVEALHAAPASDWAAYYAPLRRRLGELAPLARPPLAGPVEEMRREIDLFDRDGRSYGTVFFVVHH